MATNKSRKIGVFPGPIYFVALPFGNGVQDHNFDFKRFNRMNFSTLCTISVAFGPETSEITLLTITPFAAILQKSAYNAIFLGNPVPILTYFTGMVGVLVGMIIQIFAWRSLKGRCYGNQLNLGDVRKRRMEWSLLFASAFDNGLADCKSAFKCFNGNNPASSCPNLVNSRPVISEFTLLKRAIFAAIRPQFDDNLLRQVGVSKRLEDRNFDFSRVMAMISVHLVEIWWDSVRWPRRLRHKMLYSRRRKFFWVTSGTFSRGWGC